MKFLLLALLLFLVKVVTVVTEHLSDSQQQPNHHHSFPTFPTMRLGALHMKLNHTVDPIVDFPLDHFHNAYHLGNMCPFKTKVVDKLLRGETVNIVIVGGSVTCGAELPNRNEQRWSTPFQRYLQSGWYNGSIHVNNICMSACNVDTWIAKVGGIPAADLIIVDLSVNDQGFDVQVLPHFYRTFIQLLDGLSFQPALMFHLAYRSAKKDPREIQGHCPGYNQSITCCNGESMFCKRWWDMSEYVIAVLKEYHIPYVSYKELTWPDYYNPPTNLNHYWNGLSHPDARAHALMAKLIAFGFLSSIRHSLRRPTINCSLPETNHYVQQEQKQNNIRPLCPKPLSSMAGTEDPKSSESFQLSGTPGKLWNFFADSKQKHGYILQASKCTAADCASTRSDRTLSLKVTLGADPVVQVFYLKSFGDEMGPVKVWLDDQEDKAITLDGHWNMRTDGFLAFSESYKIPFSVSRVATLSQSTLPDVSPYIKGDQFILPGMTSGEHVLHLSALTVDQAKLKFKLLGVTTC